MYFAFSTDASWDQNGRGSLPTRNPCIFNGVYFLPFSFENKFKAAFSQTADNHTIISGFADAVRCSGTSVAGPWGEQGSPVSITSSPRPLSPSEVTAHGGKTVQPSLKSQPQTGAANMEQVYEVTGHF